LDVQASGGVKALSDVTDLALQDVAGIILGRSLLEGAFALPEAIATAAKANATC
jgi:phosphoribosylformimino-5-aminoimidazole carboxamide ribotide isomerase